MEDFLDRCADADPETAALMMALYNEGVRNCENLAGSIHDGRPWYDLDDTGMY